jgi:hypothetical protein
MIGKAQLGLSIKAAAVVVMVLGGCSGRLTFDPRAFQQDGGATALPSPATAPDARPAEDLGGAPQPLPQPPPDAAPPPPDMASLPAPPPDAMAPTPDTLPPADTAPRMVDMMPAAAACPPGTDATEILKKSCGGCHGAASPAKNLDLVSAGLAARLINKPAQCNNQPYISSTGGMDPAGLLLDKLAGPVSDCGVQMPPTGLPALSPTDVACVRAWAVDAVNKAFGR